MTNTTDTAVHRMRLAKLSPRTAKRLGKSSNHHARVWCDCMDEPVFNVGTFALPERSLYETQNDPRRLGSFDSLGIVDLRDSQSAILLWKEHVDASRV